MNTYWLLGKKGFDKVLPTPPPIGLVEIFLSFHIFDQIVDYNVAFKCCHLFNQGIAWVSMDM